MAHPAESLIAAQVRVRVVLDTPPFSSVAVILCAQRLVDCARVLGGRVVARIYGYDMEMSPDLNPQEVAKLWLELHGQQCSAENQRSS